MLRPDTYVGSLELVHESMWTWNPDKAKILFEKVEYTPGLLKIFDEILVNASDNKVIEDYQPFSYEMIR